MGYSTSLGPVRYYQFPDRIHSQYDPLDGGSACRKAATYTQDNTSMYLCDNWIIVIIRNTVKFHV
jgi:hypothetical protein